MPPLNAPIYAHVWGDRQRPKFEKIAKSEVYVGGGLSGLYRSPTGQEPCAGRRPRSRDVDRNVLAMAATAGALEPKAACLAMAPGRAQLRVGQISVRSLGKSTPITQRRLACGDRVRPPLRRIALEWVDKAGLGSAEVEPVAARLLRRDEELPATVHPLLVELVRAWVPWTTNCSVDSVASEHAAS
jgi:hypothetical protein